MAKRVWILGAGFSKPLGAPLLNELLTQQRQLRVATTLGDRYSTLWQGGKFSTAVWELARLIQRHDGDHDETKVWANAEVFLDQLDTAGRNPTGPAAKFIQDRVGGVTQADLPALSAAAKRLVAAECCEFIQGADTQTETWQPYVRWARGLDADDTVVTFNYDLVVERAAAGLAPWVVPPHGHTEETLQELQKPKRTHIFKLHGSVDWKRVEKGKGDVRYEVGQGQNFVLDAEDDEIGIATPGPGKKVAAGELDKLWTEALARISMANAVIFVGYRFPPSDAEARSRVLDALWQSRAPGRVHVHAVLGPNIAHPDVVRLEHMVDEIMTRQRVDGKWSRGKAYTVRRRPLWAEDFLSLYAPQRLHD